MIASGVFTQHDDMQAESALNRNQMISQVGGTNTGFSSNIEVAMNKATNSMVTSLSQIRNQRQTINKNSNLNEDAKLISQATLTQE